MSVAISRVLIHREYARLPKGSLASLRFASLASLRFASLRFASLAHLMPFAFSSWLNKTAIMFAALLLMWWP